MAFITFKDQKAAKKALKLNGTSVQGIDLEIEEYKVNTPKSKSTVFVQNLRSGKLFMNYNIFEFIMKNYTTYVRYSKFNC